MPNRNKLEQKTDWTTRAEGGYEKLGWVTASGLLDHLVNLASLKGNEVVVDIGAGSQAVLDVLTPHLDKGGRAFGFDISIDMLSRKSERNPKVHLFLAKSNNIPLSENSIDLATARMVFHHLEGNIPTTLREIQRTLKPSGRLIVCEYAVPEDQDVWTFERGVFDLKEPERHLWTGEQLKELIKSNWESTNGPSQIELSYATLKQYSVKDWMDKSGLPVEVRQSILQLYLQGPKTIKEKMNITITEDSDALVDRPFAYIIVHNN